MSCCSKSSGTPSPSWSFPTEQAEIGELRTGARGALADLLDKQIDLCIVRFVPFGLSVIVGLQGFAGGLPPTGSTVGMPGCLMGLGHPVAVMKLLSSVTSCWDAC